ncbi:MAG: TlpA family protein disulfide reductase [Deltaproteobacteria bacterium]|nr:TlpA family protein disulfide reductase [Deltaproteobacteria bacterium]
MTEPPPRKAAPDTLGHATLAGLDALREALTPRDRPLVVNHWATWCEGCVVELPLLVELHDRCCGQVDFLGISWDRFMASGSPLQTLQRIDATCDRLGVGWRTLVYTGAPADLFGGLALGTETIPQTALILPGGRVAWSREVPLEPEDLADLEARIRTFTATKAEG